MSGETIPSRKDIAPENTWDLSKLFPDDEKWEAGLAEFVKRAETIPSFRGTLGVSSGSLGAWLDFSRDLGVLEERLGYYAELRQTEDEGDNAARTMTGKFMMAASKAQAASAWASPELMAVPDEDMKSFMADPRLGEYVVFLSKLLRFKPHILSDR